MVATETRFAEVERGAERGAGDAGEMDRDRPDDRAVLEFSGDQVAAVGGRRLDGQGDREPAMDAKPTELERRARGALARRKLLHTENSSPV